MRWERAGAYAVAILATAAAVGLRAVLGGVLGVRMPYVTFFAAVMVSGWYGGLWPGLLATGLGAAASALWFVGPQPVAPSTATVTTISVGLFVLVGGLISVASERLHAARRALERRSEQERRERSEADRAQALLAAVVESSEDAILTKSLSGQILSWNRGAEDMFGYTAAEAIGGPVTRIVPTHRRDEEDDILRRVSQGQRVPPFETERVNRAGKVLDVSVTLSPIRDAGGVIVGASSIARDIGARKALEASLREADRRKDDFLAVLAHELRNPLAPIRNIVGVLKAAPASPATVDRASEVIDRQARHMARLLDDLLDVSRITRGRLELRREAVTLHEVLDAALESVRPALDAHEQTVSLALPDAPVHLEADPVRLAQVFANLLSNASKYSERGAAITVSAAVAGDEVAVQVDDHGIGIEPAMLQRVFEMFSQASQAVNRAQGGLGIGLALVKGLVELHGGRVDAASGGLGQGSRFTVTLPTVDTPAAVGVPGSRAEKGASGRIMVVDDNRDGADSLAMLLTLHGYHVRTVYDGYEAIGAAAEFRPQVVLLDLGMPGLDGFDTARQLRAAQSDQRLFLVAVTGWGQARDRELTTQAGFDAHLVKPVEPAELQALLIAAMA
jgi:PAS domain S-box-containing protein